MQHSPILSFREHKKTVINHRWISFRWASTHPYLIISALIKRSVFEVGKNGIIRFK